MNCRIGVVDTTFSRVDMGKMAVSHIRDHYPETIIFRRTVPGVKDLPVACKKIIQEKECDICLALGMPGPEDIDKQCAHEASMGLIQTQLMIDKHIVEVFVHMDEAKDDKDLLDITRDRIYKHSINAIHLAIKPEVFIKNAGKGMRQGRADLGSVNNGGSGK